MFEFIDGYDVQATRREAREEGIKEATERFEAKEKNMKMRLKDLKRN